jgi:hypothetical protein
MTGIGLTAVLLAVAPGDLAADVKTVFSTKCAACHGANLPRPKGRFGYVLDLRRVAGNREMVVPGEPDQSELWELVRRGEMPPEDSPTGALTDDQKATIRAWIVAGAPAAEVRHDDGLTISNGAMPSGTISSGSGATPVGETRVPPAMATLRRLGRLHVVLVHFPIAFLITAAATEAWSLARHRPPPAATVNFCVLLGASGAVTTATLGWLHAWGGAGAGMPLTLGLHRWLGMATAGVAIVAATLACLDLRRGWFRAALLAAAVLVAVTGHLGGALVFGDDFLTAT